MSSLREMLEEHDRLVADRRRLIDVLQLVDDVTIAPYIQGAIAQMDQQILESAKQIGRRCKMTGAW